MRASSDQILVLKTCFSLWNVYRLSMFIENKSRPSAVPKVTTMLTHLVPGVTNSYQLNKSWQHPGGELERDTITVYKQKRGTTNVT